VIRQVLAGLAAMALCAPVQAQDQPEPLRLKKKVRPDSEREARPSKEPPGKAEPSRKAEQPKRREANDEPEVEAQELDQQIHELMKRVSTNLHTAEERITRSDLGSGTQDIQRDVVKDLDQLIVQARRQQQQQQQQPSNSRASSSSQQSLQTRRNPRRQNQAAQNGRLPRGAGEQQTRNNNSNGGPNSNRGDKNKISDLYKDVWGHLPEALRQEVDQYSREQFMAKYNELLKQYYSTIAEKGRRKETR
jgi:hypothetical protein